MKGTEYETQVDRVVGRAVAGDRGVRPEVPLTRSRLVRWILLRHELGSRV